MKQDWMSFHIWDSKVPSFDVAGEGSDVMTDFFRDVIEATYVNFSFAKVDCQLIKAFAEVVDAALACEA